MANHLQPIRSILIDSDQSQAVREAFCVKYFRRPIALHNIAFGEKYTAQPRGKFYREKNDRPLPPCE